MNDTAPAAAHGTGAPPDDHKWREGSEGVVAYASLFEAAPTAYLTHDEHGRILAANLAAAALLGTLPALLSGASLDSFLDPEELSRLRCHLRQAARSRTREESELGLKLAGATRALQLLTVPLPGAGESPLFQSSLTPLPPREQMERCLDEWRYRMLFEHSLDAIFLTVSDGSILSANPAACRMLGMTQEEICRAGRNGLMDSSDPRLAAAVEQRRRTGKTAADLTMRGKEGESIPVALESVVLPDGTTFVIARDIRGRVKAEEALRRSEERYHALFESLKEVVILCEITEGEPPGLRLIDVNRCALRRLGISREELVGSSFLELSCADARVAASALNTALTGEPAAPGEYLCATGHWVESYLYSPHPRQVAFVSLDITERKRVELALLKSESSLAEAQHLARIGDWEWNIRSGEVRWSLELYAIYGLDPMRFTPSIDSFAPYIHPEDLARVNEVLKRSSRDAVPVNFDFRINAADGATRMVNCMGEIAAFDEEGRPALMVGVNQDITERKRYETALRESQQLYEMLAEATPDLVSMSDADGRPTYGNKRWLRYTGSSPATLCGSGCDALCHPEDLPALVAARALGVREGSAYQMEIRYRRHDGAYRWFWSRTMPVLDDDSGELTAWVAIWTDITAMREARESLRQSEQRLRALVTASSQAVWRMSADWSEMRDLHSGGFLVNCRELNRDWLREYVHPDDYPPVLAAIERASRCAGVLEVEHRVLLLDGGVSWAFTRAVPLLDEKGELREWFGTSNDITAEKQAEEALRESEERFRKIFEEGPMGGLIVSLDYRLLKVNRCFCDMLGYTAEELEGVTFTELTHPDDLETTLLQPARLLKGKKSHLSTEKRYLHKNGSAVWVTATAWLMRDRDGAPLHFIAIIEDISEKKRLQQQLIAAAKRDERARSRKTIQDYQERLRLLASKLSFAQEEERRRIAVEVHDSIGQNLAFCKLKAGQLQQRTPDCAGELGAVIDTLDRCITASRSLSFELSPSVLFDLGLEPALQWLARLHGARHGLSIIVTDSCRHELPLPSRILFFQAAREFVANVIKHSQARCAEICLSTTKKSVILSVRDDGIGFQLPKAGTVPDASSGFGLFSIQEQLRHVGGSLTIQSTPGAGTTAEAFLPLRGTAAPRRSHAHKHTFGR